MKKIVLSLAGVMAAVAFAPEASAVPVFARQTGMACSACHFQHFPLLNGFGRAFKSAGFTMMGAQGKVEGEHLDIPDRLNMAVLASAYLQNESNAGGKNGAKWGVPGQGGELSLFFGGKVSENAGFLSEFATNGGPTSVKGAGSAAIGAAKLVMLWPMGGSRVGLSAYTGGQGAAYGYEVLNTGAADTHKMMGNAGVSKQHVTAAYAGSYMGTRVDATGLTGIVTNDNFNVSIGKYAPAAVGAIGNAGANTLPLTYVRGAYIFDLAGWDSAVGIQSFSGNASALGVALGKGTVLSSYKATVLDTQFQGELGGMSTGFYVTYASAPADANGNEMAAGWSTTRKANAVAIATNSAHSLNVAATLEVMPGLATVSAALRSAKNGGLAGADGDNAIMLGATYELAQNMELGLNWTKQSGSAWTALGAAALGKTTSTLLLEALF